MSNKDQHAAVRRYLRYLEKKMQDSIENAENAGINSVAQAETDPGAGDVANWYFSSPTQMQQGSTDFKHKWGNRPLTDNWRRAAAISVANNSDDEGNEDGQSVNGLPSEESLMAKIPNTPQQKELCGKLEQRAYMMLAKAYVKQLSDYTQAINTLDTLDSRYPDNTEQEDALYLRYQVAMKRSEFDKAQGYSEALLKKFPHSQYALVLRPKQSEARHQMTSTGPVGPYFDGTYALITNHQYTDALARIDTAQQEYDDPRYLRRFEVAEAMCYAGMANYKVADSLLTGFIHSNQGDTLVAWASSVQEYVKEVRNGGMPSWYKDWPPKEEVIKSIVKGPKPKPVPPPAPPPPPPPPPPANYAYKADSEHYCIVVLPGIDSKTAALKKGIKKFDSVSFAGANLDMLLDLYDIDHGVLIIEKFKNEAQAKIYMDSLAKSPVLTAGYKPGELQLYIITKNNYRKMYADKSADPYVAFYKSNYR